MQNNPTVGDCLDLIRKHWDLTLNEAIAIIRAPVHPRTLRDEFAGLAMQANRSRLSTYESWEDLAVDAYEIADAMLKVRIKE